MKSIIGIVVVLGLFVGFSSPAFAEGCSELASRVEETLASAEITKEIEDKVVQLLEEGTALCESGEEDKAADILTQALALLGN